MKKIILSLVVIIILVVIITVNRYDQKKFIIGLWEAPLQFCEKSGIKSAYVYFNTDKVYYYINDESNTILNKCIAYTLSPNIIGNFGEENTEYEILHEEDIEPLPKKMTLRVHVNSGFMALYKDNNIHLQLYKNNKASNGAV